jgi:hypothetical protein
MSKYSTTSEYIIVDKEIWSINAGFSKSGYPLAIYTKPLRAIINQLNAMTRQYSRVLVVRFDLHLDSHTDNNTQISKFTKLLLNRLRTKYKLNDIGYAWCREQERSKQQHYHMVIFIEGRKIRTPECIWEMIQDTWWFVRGGHMTMVPYHMVYRDDYQSQQDAIYHLSYLAKTRGKGYRPIQTKDYGNSRLK